MGIGWGRCGVGWGPGQCGWGQAVKYDQIVRIATNVANKYRAVMVEVKVLRARNKELVERNVYLEQLAKQRSYCVYNLVGPKRILVVVLV